MPDYTLLTSEFDPFRGGVGTVARELSLAATRLGASIRLVAPDYHGQASAQDDTRFPFTVERFAAGPYSGRKMATYLKVAARTAKNAHDSKLVAVDYTFLEALTLTAPLHRTSFNAILHGSEIQRSAKFPRRLLARKIFSTPQHLFANSAFTRNRLLDRLPGFPEQNVTVATLGVNQEWFTKPTVSDIRQRLGLDGRRIIVCTGRITRRKGQLDLLSALQGQIAAEMSDTLAIVFAGKAMQADQTYFEEINNAAAKLAPLPIIIRDDLTDDDLRALYSEADLFCLPGSAKTTAIEGFGLVFLEAAAQSLPAVAGRIGGVPEAVLDDVSGRLVLPDDPALLGQALTQVLNDTALLQRFSEGALAHAKASSWEQFARITLGL